MSDEVKSTGIFRPDAPAVPVPAKPAGYLDNPLVRHVVGIVLSVVLAFLAARYGIAPAPIPTLPFGATTAQQPTILVINTGGAVPNVTTLTAPAGK